MELRDQTFENEWVRLEPLKPSAEFREMLRLSGILDSMWKWMPRLPGRGTTFDIYYDDVFSKTKQGLILPLIAQCRMTGAFAGGAAFMRMSRTHRSAQIGFVWTPEAKRGSNMALSIQAAMLRGTVAWRAKRVYWIVDVLNAPMIHLLEEKIGAHKDGEFEYWARMNDGRWSTSAVYSLVGDRIAEATEEIEKRIAMDFASAD